MQITVKHFNVAQCRFTRFALFSTRHIRRLVGVLVRIQERSFLFEIKEGSDELMRCSFLGLRWNRGRYRENGT